MTIVSPPSLFDAPPPEPVSAVRDWFQHAIEQGASEPGAMAFATAGAGGRPSNRIIQLLEVRPAGLVFATHAQSPKGRDIAETGWGSSVLYWRETKRQVSVCGRVAPLPDEDADALWAARPHESRAMSSVSRQSAVLEDEPALRARASSQLREPVLPRPRGWSGYLLTPSVVEFWEFSPDRLYKRLRYETAAGAGWARHRLQP